MADKKPLNRETRAAIKAFKKACKPHLNAISKARDALRELVGEIEDILETAGEGTRDFEDALDKLSQYV